MNKYFIFLLFFVFFLNEPACFSETKKEALMLDAVVVTADKTDSAFQTGDVDTESSPSFFSVIKREAFEGKMENISEVIEKEAGVQVRQSGGLGSFSTISLRGSSAEQVLIYLDGVLLNDASGGGVDLSNISLSDVEAVEIYRGVSPINFSRASVGGVVNIKTLRNEKDLCMKAKAGYGSFNTRKLSGFINHKPGMNDSGKWDYLLSADYTGSDNDFDILNDNQTRWNTADDRIEKRNNAQLDQYNILARAGFDFTRDIRLDFVNQWFKKDQRLPAWDNSRAVETSFDTERNISTLKLFANNISPLHLNTGTRISYAWKEEEYDDQGGHIGLGDQHSTYDTRRYDADIFMEWLTDANAVSFTLAFQYETYESEDHLGKSNPADSSRNTWTAGLQNTVFLFQDKLLITPALRYTIIRDKIKSGTSIWGTPLEESRRDEGFISPQIGIKYRPLEWLALKSNLAKYVREPSFFELFGDRGFFTGNPDLKEEKGINFDAGFEINRQMQDKWVQGISFHAAYFRNKADDLITRVYDARGVGKSENISEASISGLESGASVNFLKYFKLILNATWQNPKNQSEIKAFDGKNLPGNFENSYLSRIEAHYKGFKVHGEYIKETGMYYDTANLLESEDKTEINAGISWLFNSFRVSLEGRNLEDELYEDFNGYPLPGRAYYLTLEYEF